LAGTSPGDEMKLYTRIRLGRGIPSPTIGVWWVTSVEAHAATMVKATNKAALQFRDVITGSP